MKTRIELRATVALALLLTVGCGGAPKQSAPHAMNTFADARLQSLWIGAQLVISTHPITLNAALVAEGKASPVVIAPDMRANGVSPQGVSVTTVADLSVAELQAENPGVLLQHKTDPTGVISAPASATSRYCAAYSQGASIFVASSLEFSADAAGYEMQNVILARLGYNTSGR